MLITFRGRFVKALTAALLWIVLALVLVVGYTYRYELRDVADRVMAELMPATSSAADELLRLPAW